MDNQSIRLGERESQVVNLQETNKQYCVCVCVLDGWMTRVAAGGVATKYLGNDM